ncbi:chromate resistance protein [Paenibacillus sp. sptzw28]|uniref:chromate resistance protein ChrB domain-containing protein n=1 Tax=Paenibacillus sp. sptzw28 TaxID=715179 RepID=UPI001C6DEE45|nr:chromate resistance protein ChrB domain-containing protein [Paenibacillus sp. sptzw28]QYR21769.1 chromate resistance protein [Paenibacillus sp. sptzw28]
MKWVTWENVGVDRMACAWLIRKCIDSDAEFLFIPVGHKPLPEGAEPFDIPGVRLTHRRGHCTFHTMLKEFEIKDPVLERIARIVDEADTVQEAFLEPVAPGLDFICDGIRMTSPDDLTALDRGGLIFEALYSRISSEKEQ